MDQDKKIDQEDSSKYFKIKKFHAVIWVFLLVFLTAGITTFALTYGDEKVVEPQIVNAGPRSEFTKLYQAFDMINETYVEEVDEEALIEGAIDGMVEAIGDPYSDYMTAEETANFYQSITSSFEGIGAQVEQRDDKIVIVAPIKGTPAEKAGLRPNDVIVEVDGQSVQGMSVTNAVMLIRGEKGTKVELTIERPSVEGLIKVEIIRDVIPIETVYYEMIDDQIGKIQITQFSERTFDELKTAIADLKEQGAQGFVFDLRQNPGGLLNQAIEISSMFVPKGEVIYQMQFNDGSKQRQLSSQKDEFEYPFVVVVDGGSASASEIFAAAVQESAGVPIIGEQTFGKGTAQTARDFHDGSNLKLTTAKWLTPSGKWINEEGVKPDYEVSLPEYAFLPYVDTNLELKENMMSDEILTIEKMLDALGYSVGSVDGHFDEDTKNAVLDFQSDKGIEQTGIVQGETTMAIMQALSQKLEEEDPQIQKAVEVLQGLMK